MSRIRSILALVLAMLPGTGTALAEKRVALVIGNAAYANAGALANPANDAKDIAARLKDAGFNVVLGVDLNKAGFDGKVREFAAALDSADSAILFYAGHGLQVGGQNYLVPVDAKLARERDLDFEAVKLDFILKQMELGRETKTNIVFLDACRDNPLSRSLARTMGTRSASVGQGLAQVDAGVGTFISYSTQPGNVALDGAGRNSPFSAALAKRIKEPGRSLTSIMIDVRKDVIAATDGKQVPWDHSALTGDFYFSGPAKGQNPKALEGRVRELESALDTKSKAAAAASNAALVDLKSRISQMDDENRRDRERMFDLQRKASTEKDATARGTLNLEAGKILMQITRRSQDQAALRGEIEKLEKAVSADSPAEPPAKKK